VKRRGSSRLPRRFRQSATNLDKGIPFKIYAEVKPLTQGTAGTIYKCLGATSKTRTISGG
jgi:hypothetical protein